MEWMGFVLLVFIRDIERIWQEIADDHVFAVAIRVITDSDAEIVMRSVDAIDVARLRDVIVGSTGVKLPEVDVRVELRDIAVD